MNLEFLSFLTNKFERDTKIFAFTVLTSNGKNNQGIITVAYRRGGQKIQIKDLIPILIKPLRLDIKKKLSSRSERVKSVDFHPTESWVLTALYTGSVVIWNYDTQMLVKSFEVTNLPVRNAKFIGRKQWIIASADDLQIRVFNYNTMERVVAFEAHTDYIRYLEIHPSLPYILSCADDMQIKLWDWDKKWQCTSVFEGHSHYVMMAKFNPKDTNTFASASLDRSIKVWGIGSSQPHFSLEGHERGVNCVDYYPGGDKPYLVSGSDDRTIKIWDYQVKSIIQTLDGHSHNLTSVIYHPKLPLIVSACEDGTVRMWHNITYRAEATLNYGMERAWSLSALKGSNKLAIGYDEGTVVLRLGHDMPIVSMDQNGKVIWADNNEVQTCSVKGLVCENDIADGEKLPISLRDLGSCEIIYPDLLRHNSNGRFIVICGDGEYIIYTSQQLRNKTYGSALDFVWSTSQTGDYIIRESINSIKLYKNFTEYKKMDNKTLGGGLSSIEGLFTGNAVGLRTSDGVAMYDWDELRLIRKIEVSNIKNVYWNDSGDLVAIICSESYYVLKYNKDIVSQAFLTNSSINKPEGIDGAFDLLSEINEKVRTGTWIGDCFIYTNNNSRLNYFVGGEVMTVAHIDQKLYILGYMPKENRIYLIDKNKKIISYHLNITILEYQTAVVRGDFTLANNILPQIDQSEINNVAHFLDSQGFKQEALQLTNDPDLKFELCIQLHKLQHAKEIMLEINSQAERNQSEYSMVDIEQKWKQLGDLALTEYEFELALYCAEKANDYGGLLLLYYSTGNYDKILQLAEKCQTDEDKKYNNITFMCYFLCNKCEECVNLLLHNNRIPEACFFAKTYVPSRVSEIVQKWKDQLITDGNTRLANAIVDPTNVGDESTSISFPDFDIALKLEKKMENFRNISKPAKYADSLVQKLDINCIDYYKKNNGQLFIDEIKFDGLNIQPQSSTTSSRLENNKKDIQQHTTPQDSQLKYPSSDTSNEGTSQEKSKLALEKQNAEEEKKKSQQLLEKQKIEEEQRLLILQKQKEDERQRILLLEKKQEEDEKKRLFELEKERQKEEERQKNLLLEKQKKEEIEKQRLLQLQREKMEEERQKALIEEKRKEEEKQRLLQLQREKMEADRQKALLEEKRKEEEKQRLLLLEKQKKEEEERQRLFEEKERIKLLEKKKKEDEDKRQQLLLEKKKKEEEEQKLKEQEKQTLLHFTSHPSSTNSYTNSVSSLFPTSVTSSLSSASDLFSSLSFSNPISNSNIPTTNEIPDYFTQPITSSSTTTNDSTMNINPTSTRLDFDVKDDELDFDDDGDWGDM